MLRNRLLHLFFVVLILIGTRGVWLTGTWLMAPDYPPPLHVPGQVKGDLLSYVLSYLPPGSGVHGSVISPAEVSTLLSHRKIRAMEVGGSFQPHGLTTYAVEVLLTSGRMVSAFGLSLNGAWHLIRMAVHQRTPVYEVHLHLDGFPYAPYCHDTHLKCGLFQLLLWTTHMLPH